MALGGAAARPLAARAQQPDKMRRIGVLMGTFENSRDGQLQVGALRKKLQQLGWADGRNAQFYYRWLRGEAGEARPLAKDLIALQPDVLVTHGTPISVAVLQETRLIPIVFVNVADPVNAGLVTSFAHPGGNATGFMNMDPSMGGKWLEVLKEFLPSIRRVAFMFNPDTAAAAGRYYLPAFEAAAASLAVEPMVAAVHSAAEIDKVIGELAGQPDDGLIVTPDLFLAANRPLIIELAARHRVPTIYVSRLHVETGGLISYGTDSIGIFERAAAYVDRILKGEKPSDLPVQSPTKFELVINLKTAKALGLTVNRDFLMRADEVIE
ncbi:MAG TPA: ABC transporter substrate-binding protein [Xanthobacteraceae bacterium]|nr:ABC transporter substrate-binding protein [Xanthobacteraceae bacterium]